MKKLKILASIIITFCLMLTTTSAFAQDATTSIPTKETTKAVQKQLTAQQKNEMGFMLKMRPYLKEENGKMVLTEKSHEKIGISENDYKIAKGVVTAFNAGEKRPTIELDGTYACPDYQCKNNDYYYMGYGYWYFSHSDILAINMACGGGVSITGLYNQLVKLAEEDGYWPPAIPCYALAVAIVAVGLSFLNFLDWYGGYNGAVLDLNVFGLN